MTDTPELLAARADFCRLLAACYYEPGPEFAEERLFDSMGQAAARVDAQLAASAQALGAAFAATPLQDLLVDYARLFLGPIDAPARPYGSVWLPGEEGLMGRSSMALQELYREAGFDLSEDFRELPDHVAVELEFLYVLLFREASGRASGDGASGAQEMKSRFLGNHLDAWIDPFTQAMQHAAETRFYRELAAVTQRFVRMEANRHSRG